MNIFKKVLKIFKKLKDYKITHNRHFYIIDINDLNCVSKKKLN